MLRGATKEGFLRGWYFYGGRGSLPIRYVISPPNSEVLIYETDDVIRYCEMLAAAGIVAIYLT